MAAAFSDRAQAETDAYDRISLGYEIPCAADLDSLTSAQLALLDLRLFLLPFSAEHQQLVHQANQIWERRNWIHLETSPTSEVRPSPEQHHTICLDFSGPLSELDTAQLLGVKYQEGVDDARKEAAQQEIMRRRKRAKLASRHISGQITVHGPLPQEVHMGQLPPTIVRQFSSLGETQQRRVREAAGILAECQCWPCTDHFPPPLDSLQPKPQAEGVTPQPAPPPETISEPVSPPSAQKDGWDDQTVVDMDLDQSTLQSMSPPLKVKREEPDTSMPPPPSPVSARTSNITSIAVLPPSSPAPTPRPRSQPQQQHPAPKPNSSTQPHPPASPSSSVAEPSRALSRLFACYFTYKDNLNNVNQLLHSKALAPHTANIVAQIDLTAATAVAYFKSHAHRSSFLLSLRAKDPEKKRMAADVGEVNMAAGLTWEDVREPHRAWLTLLCRKLAKSPTPEPTVPKDRSREPLDLSLLSGRPNDVPLELRQELERRQREALLSRSNSPAAATTARTMGQGSWPIESVAKPPFSSDDTHQPVKLPASEPLSAAHTSALKSPATSSTLQQPHFAGPSQGSTSSGESQSKLNSNARMQIPPNAPSRPPNANPLNTPSTKDITNAKIPSGEPAVAERPKMPSNPPHQPTAQSGSQIKNLRTAPPLSSAPSGLRPPPPFGHVRGNSHQMRSPPPSDNRGNRVTDTYIPSAPRRMAPLPARSRMESRSPPPPAMSRMKSPMYRPGQYSPPPPHPLQQKRARSPDLEHAANNKRSNAGSHQATLAQNPTSSVDTNFSAATAGPSLMDRMDVHADEPPGKRARNQKGSTPPPLRGNLGSRLSMPKSPRLRERLPQKADSLLGRLN